jgi:hypothetical protein
MATPCKPECHLPQPTAGIPDIQRIAVVESGEVFLEQFEPPRALLRTVDALLEGIGEGIEIAVDFVCFCLFHIVIKCAYRHISATEVATPGSCLPFFSR